MPSGIDRLKGLVDCGLPSGTHLIVGVSGGADSLCLLSLLLKVGYRCTAAHLDHGLRESSPEDARHVARLAQAWKVTAVIERRDAAAYARANRLSIEEAARNVRYDFLFATAELLGADGVAVGHTADDQVETILMHLLRGAGPEGLSGMPACSTKHPWESSLPLVRPLLGFWRSDTEQYCREQGIEFRTDESNVDTAFFRNRLRMKLLPMLDSYVPGVKKRLLKTAEVLEAENVILSEATDRLWDLAFVSDRPGLLVFRLEPLRQAEKALQRRLFRRAFRHLLPDERDLDFAAVERAIGYMRADDPVGPVDWLAGLRLVRRKGEVLITGGELPVSPDWLQMDPNSVIELSVPGHVRLSGRHRITAEYSPAGQWGSDPNSAWLDADPIALPLLVRARRAGDRFQPLGMEQGTQKLSDFFINSGLDTGARERWPLVWSGEQIAWIPGFRPAHWARIRPETSRAILLKVVED